ncbi:FUSC family protein [Pseudomonas aeruginosa]|nr:FUSC family protein [Pseudomonas aeruginosa]
MSGRSAGFALPSRDEWRRALAEWARSDGATWIYVFKVLCAAFLTLWLAMRLELPQPSTATITVFIVMQPQSGQVFAKSFYRILGTLVGLSVMVTLIALFAQERVLFLLSSAIWIGLCTAGAARYRDFRSYACVLAGYTATLIGIPATSHPEGAFMQAIWRVLEISLAILCSGVVSAVIMPQTTSAAMRNALYVRFGLFAAFVLDSLRGVGGRERFESSNVAFAAQAVGLETMRAASAFEDPHMRLRNGRLIRLSSEFMAMNTRFHALHQLLERLRAQGSTQVLDAFEPCLEEITGLLEEIRGRAVTDHDAERFAQRRADCRERLMARIRQARGELLAREPGEEARLDFNTAAELLYRFAEEMHDYALTHASLAAHRHEREQWKDAFTAKANAVAAAVAGMRTGLMILLFGCFWIYSTWPSGGTFALNAVAVSALASAAPNPKKVAMQMAIGTMAAALLGFSEMFFVYPHIDGFPLLCLVLAPVFALGAFISSRPQWAGYGLGLLVFFCFGSVPANLSVYDPAHVINEYIALILSMLLSAAAAAVILPPNSAWLWKRLERDLRMRVVFAISGRSRGLGSAFESGTRDLLNQAYGVAAGRPDVQRGLLRWMFLVLEVGHAIIELRREQERLPDEPCYAEAMPWRQAIRAMGRALIRLFVRPGAENLERALAAVDQAIHAARNTDEPCAPHFDSSPLRRVRSYLHFIRSSLLAPTSPLTELAGRTSGQGTVHAS